MDFLLQNKILILFFLAYLLIISVVAFVVTLYDKWAAVKRPQERTRESTLLLLSALGGASAMLLTMLGTFSYSGPCSRLSGPRATWASS